MTAATGSPISVALRQFDLAIERADAELAQARARHAQSVNAAAERCQATLDANEADGIKVTVGYKPQEERHA